MSRTKRGLPVDPQPRRSAAAELVGARDRPRQTDPISDAESFPKPRTRRITLDLEAPVVEELKDAVVYLQHNGHPEATQVKLVTTGFKNVLEQLARDHSLKRFPLAASCPSSPLDVRLEAWKDLVHRHSPHLTAALKCSPPATHVATGNDARAPSRSGRVGSHN